MDTTQLITQLTSLKDELFDEESKLLSERDSLTNSKPDFRRIAKNRIYITALDNVLNQLKLVSHFTSKV